MGHQNDLLQKDYPLLYDFDYQGGLTNQGAIKEVWNEEALNNSIKMWLASYTNEVVRRPGVGGRLTSLINTPMNQADVDAISAGIELGITTDFRPFVRLKNLKVTPDYENRTWSIYMEIYSPDKGIYTTVSEKIRNLV